MTPKNLKALLGNDFSVVSKSGRSYAVSPPKVKGYPGRKRYEKTNNVDNSKKGGIMDSLKGGKI